MKIIIALIIALTFAGIYLYASQQEKPKITVVI
jgi:hypothetical protein